MSSLEDRIYALIVLWTKWASFLRLDDWMSFQKDSLFAKARIWPINQMADGMNSDITQTKVNKAVR